jgi:citrate synthase
MLTQEGQKIGRPRQKYTGDLNRTFAPLSDK